MTKLHYVKKARKENKAAGIKKGDSYYWWQFAFRSKQVSKTLPRRSQYMTQSEHLGAIYDLEDQINEMTIESIDESCLEDIISEIGNLIDTCEDRLNNMPEQLQQAPAGETLQEYIDNLEQWQSDLEDIDLSIDIEKENDESDDDFEERVDERKEEILNEIQSTSYPG